MTVIELRDILNQAIESGKGDYLVYNAQVVEPVEEVLIDEILWEDLNTISIY